MKHPDWLQAGRLWLPGFGGQWARTERLRALQRARLESQLVYAQRHVPFYRQGWPEDALQRVRAEGLAALPRLRREAVAADPAAFLAESVRRARRLGLGSSARGPAEPRGRAPDLGARGSFDPRPPSRETTALELRRRRACAGTRLSRRVIRLEALPRTAPEPLATPEGWLRGLRSLSLDEAPELHLWLYRDYRPHHIEAPALYLEELARVWGDRERARVPLRSLTTCGEWIPERARERIREAFGVPVLDVYGSPELGEVAWQCREGGGYHINMESAWVEIEGEDGRPVPPGTLGEVVVTSLANRALPLVRYATGDRASLLDGPCSCGRGLLRLGEVQGRAQGALLFPGGRRISPYSLTMAIERCPGVLRYRVVQQSSDWLDVPVVVRGSADPVADAVRRSLAAVVGSAVHIGVRIVPELPRDPQGSREAVRVARGAAAPDRASAQLSGALLSARLMVQS